MWARLTSAPALRRAGLIVSVFLAIWSVKLWTIGRYGTDLPYWDQWAKEGELFYAPWFQHHEFWHNLFIPHNEHRIAPTLAMNLGLLVWGGDQWDARVQCVASAALHALLMAGLAAWALRRFSRRWALACAALLVLVTAPPIAWDNVLGGFQSQFYFLALFSIVAMGLMLGSAAFSVGWLVGIASAALACVSMGSGMLVAAPLAVVAAVRLLRREARGERREAGARRSEVRDQISDPNRARARARYGGLQRLDSLATLIVALLIGAIGWYYRPQAPWHASIHAHQLSESLLYAARCLSWPLYGTPWLAILFWAPWVVLAGLWIAGRTSRPRRAVEAHESSTRPDRSQARLTGDGSPYLGGAPSPADQRGNERERVAPLKDNHPRLAADFILAGGLWVLAQIAAVTYSRAGAGDIPAVRYGDICALGLVFNAFALAWLGTYGSRGYDLSAEGWAKAERERVAAAEGGRAPSEPLAHARSHVEGSGRGALTPRFLPATLWFLAVALAITLATRTDLRTDLPQKKSQSTTYERNVQAFVLTDDYAALQRENGELPFPLPDWLARILRNPTLRRLLPPSVREPISVSGFASPRGPAPVLANRATRTVIGTGEWRSAPIAAGHGWWKIETAGAVTAPGDSLTLVSAATGHVLATIAPTKVPGDSWRAAYVPAPREPALIVAKVAAPGQWLAFSEPIEMSSLGHAVWRLTLNAWLVALLAAAGLLAFGWSIAREPRER